MARLNEVPAPAAESVEALKRRFIRQNREIARVNSNQSIRIRNLETEISRLLAENIAIREEAINVRTEADKWKASQRLNREVVRMKEQLELKLSEVTALVGELGALPEKVARRSSQRRRQGGLISELMNSGAQREPRQRHTMLEQEGRLPAILEDKHYPRRTLETKEIQALAHENNDEATESPDLGPPPVTHFDDTETVMFNATRSPRRTSMELIEESERINRSSATSIDSRRKRRASTLLASSAVDNMAMTAPEEAELTIPEPEKRDVLDQPRPILKTGAKRKLEASELEDTSRVSKELDDFIFQRKSNPPPIIAARQSRFSRPTARHDQEHAESLKERSPERSTQPARKILAPKSTNSPAKRNVEASYPKLDAAKDDTSEKVYERRVVSRIRTKPSNVDLSDTREAAPKDERYQRDAEDAEDRTRLAPKTPAVDIENIMSPTSTEPSTKQRAPKEMAVTNSVEDVLSGSIGRGTRRIRAPVNYAQPNLRDKMRRPGKELVGAVEGLIKPQTDSDQETSRTRRNSVDVDSAKQGQNMNVPAGNVGGPNVMDEKERIRRQALERGQGGKSEPASPLRDKVAPTQRKSDHKAEGIEDELSNAVSRLSVFDPLKSSPVSAEFGVDPTSTAKDRSIQSRTLEESIANPGVLVPRSRRPSSALSTRQSERQDETDDGQRKSHVRRSVSVMNLPPVSQLGHKRLASTSRLNTPIEPAQSEVLEPRTRSNALTRRKSSLMV